MAKKTICLVTNWYPTKENPFQGLFFKEQAFAVSKNFNFIILHYKEHVGKKKLSIITTPQIYKEKNTTEYTFDVYCPISLYIADAVNDFKVKHINGKMIDGVGKYISNKHRLFTYKKITKLFDKYITENIDAFYCVDAQQEAFYVQCLAEHYNKPYIVGEHAPVPWMGSVIKDVNKFGIEKANMFFAISNDKIRQLMMQNIKLPEICYIGNLIDEDRLLINRNNNNEVKTFIIVAAHSFYKNYDLFISVMNRLTMITEQDFKVMIVGYGANKGYSKNVNELEEKINKSMFADKAIMIPSVPHKKIGEMLSKADAFIMTSIQEGQPVSAMEAACCGLPVFSTRCGGVEDYIDDKMGRIYSVMDCEGMAQGLKEYLEGELEFDADYIRNQVVMKFGNEAFVEKFSKAFYKVIVDD